VHELKEGGEVVALVDDVVQGVELLHERFGLSAWPLVRVDEATEVSVDVGDVGLGDAVDVGREVVPKQGERIDVVDGA
jgi:hypothetical protein